MATPSAVQRVLITGVTGSGGSYLAEYLADHQPQVQIHGVSRWHSTATARNLFKIQDRVQAHECDLNDLSAIFGVLTKVRPDVIFHLAAHANVKASFATPLSVINNNVMGTVNLFEAVRMAEITPTILLASSSEVYGKVDRKHVPIKEDAPMNPPSPYGVSKVAQDLLGWSYFVSYGMKIIRTRAFAYINPRRADLFASAFARQIARVELGLQSEVLHGNLDSVRTLCDVRDMMEGYWLAALHCTPGEAYNISGEDTMTVGEFLNRLIARCGRPIPKRLDPALLRPSDVTLQIPNIEKFVSATGWKTKHTLDESMDLLLQYWRREAPREAEWARIAGAS